MARLNSSTEPISVFISYGSPNRMFAKRLAADLNERGIEPFLDVANIGLGSNPWSAISEHLMASDYFVLMWSADVVHRPAVEVEWNAALDRELRSSFTFLYVLRIEDIDPPQILRPRRYLDAFKDWDTAVDELVQYWHRDQTNRERAVLPAPNVQSDSITRSNVEVKIRNKDLEFDYVVLVPRALSSQQLNDYVLDALALPHQKSTRVEDVECILTFEYRLFYNGTRLVIADDQMVTLDQPVVLELEVLVAGSLKEGGYGEVRSYLPAGLSESDVNFAAQPFFKHLTPPPARVR